MAKKLYCFGLKELLYLNIWLRSDIVLVKDLPYLELWLRRDIGFGLKQLLY